jgi:hypothetical protein
MLVRASALSVLGTSAFAFVASFAIGTLAVARNDWFGSGDLLPFANYSVPFAAGVWPLSRVLWFATRRLLLSLTLIVAFVLGLLYGYAATYALALVLGPWIGAVSVPVLRVWCSVGALSLTSALLLMRRGVDIRSIAGVVALAAVSTSVFFGLQPALALTTDNQHLTVVLLRHHPGDYPLTVSSARHPDAGDIVDSSDIALLAETRLRGTLEVRGSHASNSVEWPRAKALVVFAGPLEHEVSLPQPKHRATVFLQTGDGFQQVPADSPTLHRSIRFYREKGDWHVQVEHSSGARSGGYISP